MARVDYIVAGCGVAGSCVLFELLRRGKKAVGVDDSLRGAASLVAAGVINPITGKRLVKSWRSAEAHPYAKKFYKDLERELGARFYRERKILQLCKSPEEDALWSERAELGGYREFVGGRNAAGSFGILNDAFGSRFVERSAWVEPRALIDAFRKYFLSRGVLLEKNLDFSEIDSGGVLLRWGDFSARAIIFCDGWRAVKNPYFSWLPYRPAKGEILEVKSSAPLPEHIIHRGGWLMKVSESSFRIGSTWDRENLDCAPTPAARAELLGNIKNFFRSEVSAEVSAHFAGVRPCTATTRPHIGAHPADPRFLSFNGLGSKGCALSPCMAKIFCGWLCGENALDPEADLSRHVAKFFNRPKAEVS